MKRMRPLILLALALIMLLPMAASAQTTLPATPNPLANITFPPPIYVLSGQFQIIGSANLPNMSNYFIEFRPIPEDVTIPSTASWAPATVPSRRAVQDDVLGVWDTNTVDDGAYEIRLTVNIRGGQPVQHVVTPLRVENNPRFGGRVPWRHRPQRSRPLQRSHRRRRPIRRRARRLARCAATCAAVTAPIIRFWQRSIRVRRC